MATAFLAPGEREKMDRQRQRMADMQSLDPVTRYRAREAALNEGLINLSRGLLKRADAAEVEIQRLRRMEEDFNRNPFGNR